MFANDVTNKGLISKIYNSSLTKTTQPNQKVGRDPNRHSSREERRLTST